MVGERHPDKANTASIMPMAVPVRFLAMSTATAKKAAFAHIENPTAKEINNRAKFAE